MLQPIPTGLILSTVDQFPLKGQGTPHVSGALLGRPLIITPNTVVDWGMDLIVPHHPGKWRKLTIEVRI
jgi:hypothetical protein